MQFALAFDNDIREHIIEQVFANCLPEVVSEEKAEKMEVYLGTKNTIQVYLKTTMFEIPDVFFNANWDIIQWDTPELHRRDD